MIIMMVLFLLRFKLPGLDLCASFPLGKVRDSFQNCFQSLDMTPRSQEAVSSLEFEI